MSDFQFGTRGQQSPQGKQRVYFTCHPDDFEFFFEEIKKEILDRQDCAIFYLEPSTQPADVEDYELRLREMQLFVVPVTTKLLTKENRAMDVEVPFAFENHIPVLPLMQESGLDDVYNKRFGDLQYLNKRDLDPTVIQYDEKLTKYLESVIVGDELAKKIRAAFDAYIFLSYRKKDRKYAQELMSLIHSNPICRDIAIWYDEFLTPGESFNEAIRAAIEKCELFAIAVTPNLVNEINYILTTEYPMAREMNKKILPAEMEQTDRDKFSKMYVDIPDLIAKDDTSTLADKLSKLFESLAMRQNDTDPQHNFFIGLAYLGGIDVEISYERAINLIEQSAKQGLMEAMMKLSQMYEIGEGVDRDFLVSAGWQKKIVNKLKSNETIMEVFDENYAKEIWRLGALYNKAKKRPEAKKAYLSLMEYCKLFELSESVQLLYLLIIACNNLGSIYLLSKNTQLSKKYYLDAINYISNSSYGENNSFIRLLSVAYGNIGMAFEFANDFSNSSKYYNKCRIIREKLAITVGDKQDLFNLFYCYHNLLCVYLKAKKDTIEIENVYILAMRSAEQAIMCSNNSFEGIEIKNKLIGLYNDFIEFCKKNGNDNLANEYILKLRTIK